MYRYIVSILFFLTLQTFCGATSDSVQAQESSNVQNASNNTPTADVDLLDELDSDMNHLIDIGGIIPEDIPEKNPAWKNVLIKTADFAYWTYQTSVETVTLLYNKCTKWVSNSDEAEKTE